MFTAIVLIDCATNLIPEVAETLANLDGVSEVYSVAGSIDLIAIVRVAQFDAIAEVIAGSISKTPGVVSTDRTSRSARTRSTTSTRRSRSASPTPTEPSGKPVLL